MNRMFMAIASGIIEGLLISSAVFSRDALAFIAVAAFKTRNLDYQVEGDVNHRNYVLIDLKEFILTDCLQLVEQLC